MPLPPELDQKIRSRFDELIQEADELIREGGDSAEHEAFLTKSLSLTNKVFDGSERGREIAERINLKFHQLRMTSALNAVRGILQGLRDDYENGFLDDLEDTIVANISSDYMAQVEEILTEGRSDTYDHIFAAVICGAVLEDALRRLCERQTPPISTRRRNGKPKRLDAMVSELQMAKVYNALKADQLRAWAKVRNHAAHGEFEEFNRTDVEDMVKGVRNFLADYL